jgi:hypothetical protein
MALALLKNNIPGRKSLFGLVISDKKRGLSALTPGVNVKKTFFSLSPML